MTLTLAEAKTRAHAFRAAGDRTAALATLHHILQAQPLDDDVRLEIADLLASAGKTREATALYRALGPFLLRAGRPLPALVAAHALGSLGEPFDELLTAEADMYAAGSPHLAPFASRSAPLDPTAPIPDLEPPGSTTDAGDFDRLVEPALERALALEALSPVEQVHPIPFLSELQADSLHAVLASLQVRRIGVGESAVRQGEPGTSLFLVAAGLLQVTTTLDGGAQRDLAQLHENSLFGEMALVTSQPRGASVIAIENSVVLELDRTALDRIRAKLPNTDVALARFTRERLIKNLLATSPLFTPFTREQQKQLLERFEGTEVDAGTTLIHQGQLGLGLYVVVAGDLDVVAHADDAADPIVLGHLHPGDICGEMSLLTDQPTTATVRAASACTLLFLPRLYFDRLTAAVPEVKGYFADVAQRRANDNSTRISAAAWPEEPVELDDSDQILI